jgi:hypothetical protein
MSVSELGSMDAPSRSRVAPSSWRREHLLLPAAFLVAGLALFTVYLRQAQTLPVESDGATQALQAWDMLHGNPLLRGWLLTDVSFYTTEHPQYMLVELLHGLNSDTVYISAAMTYTFMVLLAALLAKGTAAGREGASRALMAAGIMLAPSLGLATYALIANPDHTGTQVPLLLVWLVLDRARPGWRPAVAVAVLLAWAQVADPLVLYEGALPIAVVCVMRMYRRRGPLRGHWYELSLIAAAVAAAGMATLALKLILAVGGFSVGSPGGTFAYVDTLSSNVWVTAESVLQLYGADFSGHVIDMGAVIPLVHLVGVLLAAWAWAHAIRHFFASELLVQVLAVAAAVLLIAYTLRGNPILTGSPHEIAGVLPIGAVLAGRLLPARLSSAGLVPTLALVLACYAGFLGYNAAQPAAHSNRAQLASWLAANHLIHGLSDYWTAASVTVYSGNRVQVRPPDRRGSDSSWYDPAVHDARFYLIPTACPSLPAAARDAWRHTVEAAYGKPAATYSAAGYLVMVWHKNLLAGQLPPIPPPTNNCAEGSTTYLNP